MDDEAQLLTLYRLREVQARKLLLISGRLRDQRAAMVPETPEEQALVEALDRLFAYEGQHTHRELILECPKEWQVLSAEVRRLIIVVDQQ